MRHHLKADATCTNCHTLFEDLPVQRDEDGGYVELETVPCHDDECNKKLCGCCSQFVCHCCGLIFCMDHVGQEEEPDCTCIRTDVDQVDARTCELHGTRYPRTLYFCRVCTADEVFEPAVLHLPPSVAAQLPAQVSDLMLDEGVA